jgi:hypothetical protein
MRWVLTISLFFLIPLQAEEVAEIHLCSTQNLYTKEETAFIADLSAMHRCLFTSCFGAAERQAAMQYVTNPRGQKMAGISSDMAVELALKSCRGMTKTVEPTQLQPMQEQSSSSVKPKKRSPCSKSAE